MVGSTKSTVGDVASRQEGAWGHCGVRSIVPERDNRYLEISSKFELDVKKNKKTYHTIRPSARYNGKKCPHGFHKYFSVCLLRFGLNGGVTVLVIPVR
jgi:hypothetical protein